MSGLFSLTVRRRKVEGGMGGFKISGNANYLPYSDEELAQQAEQAAKK